MNEFWKEFSFIKWRSSLLKCTALYQTATSLLIFVRMVVSKLVVLNENICLYFQGSHMMEVRGSVSIVLGSQVYSLGVFSLRVFSLQVFSLDLTRVFSLFLTISSILEVDMSHV